MEKLEQIKEAIESLPEGDFARLRKWLADKDYQRWDEQIEKDSQEGRLDSLVKEAQEEKKGGKLENL
jgi:hypothetical protein